MTEQYAVAALIRKRASLAGEIEQMQVRLRQLVADITSVDHTLRLLKPDIELEDIKPTAAMPWQQAFRGETFRIVLETLRASSRPVFAHEIAMNVMADKQLNTADKNLVKKFSARIGSVLRYHRRRGKVKATRGPGKKMLWEIAQ